MSRVDPQALERRIARYRRLARRYDRLGARVERVISTIAAVRFIAFAVGFLCVVAGLYERSFTPWYGPIAAIAFGVFGVAVWLHRRPFALAPRLRMGGRISAESADRLAGVWSAVPDDGSRFLDPAEPSLGELQVFGPTSLFSAVNRAGLPASRRRLAELLRAGLDPAEVPGRQTAAAELARQPLLRQRLAIESRLVEFDEAAMNGVIDWAEAESDVAKRLKPWAMLARLLVPATLIQIVLTFGFEIATAWQFTLIAQGTIWAITTRFVTPHYLHLLGEAHHKPFTALQRMFELVEARRFEAAALKAIQARLGRGEKGNDALPSRRMARFEAIVGALEVRHSGLLYAAVSIVLLWEVLQGWRLEQWRLRHGRSLRADLQALADLEALASVGGFAFDHPLYAWPTVREPDAAGVPLEATEIGHPLFDPARRVCNDFQLDHRGRLVLITGSNMSGKSSFLRTLGINARLAFSGAPVCAADLRIVRCHPSTSIQVTDAPEQGLSRFYAEVKRIRSVMDQIDAAEAPGTIPRLYLIDEMLSGTNSRERHLACRTIVHRLVDSKRSFGLVTTHDLSLVGIAEELPAQVECGHFSDRFDGEKLHFDYTLKPGVATTTNALHVLAMEGIDVPVDVDDAEPQETA